MVKLHDVNFHACVVVKLVLLSTATGNDEKEAAPLTVSFSSLNARLCNLAKIGLFNVALNVPRRIVSSKSGDN